MTCPPGASTLLTSARSDTSRCGSMCSNTASAVTTSKNPSSNGNLALLLDVELHEGDPLQRGVVGMRLLDKLVDAELLRKGASTEEQGVRATPDVEDPATS